MPNCKTRSSLTRRHALVGLLSTAASAALLDPNALLAQDLMQGPMPAPEAAPTPVHFDFDTLSEDMRLAAKAPAKPAEVIKGFLTELSYDDYQRVQFDRTRTRWADTENARFHLNAFHPGWLFNEPVHLNEIVDSISTPMGFSVDDFDYSNVDKEIPETFEMPGVAGFRLMAPLNRADHHDELAAFLGASYFRALGQDNRYGLSARGLAINTGMPAGEEFPRFTDFWLERPTENSDKVVLYAALRSKSVTGAYRFVIEPGKTTTMDVTARLYMRENVQQLGIAPLTSMFLFGGADPGNFNDFRPAVHDSDHLILNTQSGDTFVRPLTNPEKLGHSYLAAQNPVSFGLIQRQRDFDHYLDAQAHYERRPSLMVEPIGDWGAGSVRLMEIPTDLEGNDNIVAYWVPEKTPQKGESLEVSYRLHWGMSPDGDRAPTRAQVLRTRTGVGGVAGVEKATDSIKFVIDFQGGTLSSLPIDAKVEPQVTVLRGKLTQSILSPVDGTDLWRLVIEAVPENSETSMELQAALKGYGSILSETWLYQWKA
ncbi:glucans biosynthesis protein [Pacificibacter maritimus]|uniref:Glucans biosynthesis protein n=1 Tax=Pacificibacter maritimus TaxID=762213 RepID=A0A3N4UPZ0_9RHOB|nr:glucan biosynthesis protein G [Pacificibacter maritimus]RPE72118.1 glucans biosynthesis protein [Pacificibacter maritimus]